VCSKDGLYKCTGDECGATGVCDKNGCGYNNYVLGNDTYYGPGLIVDTSRPFTVVTQFPATDNTLTEIRRLYVQDGTVIQNAAINISGPPAGDSITDDYCTAMGATAFESLGALAGMGGALSRGMVLIFSIWWDTTGYMTWLDSGNAGPCSATEGNPTEIVTVEPNPTVTFSNIKWGEIGSTYADSKIPTNGNSAGHGAHGSHHGH
jgi:cellulase